MCVLTAECKICENGFESRPRQIQKISKVCKSFNFKTVIKVHKILNKTSTNCIPYKKHNKISANLDINEQNKVIRSMLQAF